MASTVVVASVRPVALAARGAARPSLALRPARASRPAIGRSPVVVRAENSDDLSAKAAATAEELKKKWEATEEKPAAIALAVSGFVGVWAANGVVSAVDSLPIIGDLFEFIGLLVTAWFVYRYLLFGPDRAELKTKIDGFFAKMTGKAGSSTPAAPKPTPKPATPSPSRPSSEMLDDDN